MFPMLRGICEKGVEQFKVILGVVREYLLHIDRQFQEPAECFERPTCH